MRRLFGTLCGFLFAVSVGYAIPARPLYLPEAPPKAPVVKAVAININGTAWIGKVSATNRIFVFEADGTVSYKTPTSKANPIKNRGNWRLEGSTLIFDHYITKGNTILEFRGTVQDPNTIVGESWTKAGVRTPQTLQRSPLDEPVVLPKKKAKVIDGR
jgi:hypothetical protein